MKTKKPNAALLWKQLEEDLVPRLGLNLAERVVYAYLVRQSRLEGKREFRFELFGSAAAFAFRMLIVFGGLPGTGKTTIARELVRQLGAVHLRIDTIEQALRDCGALRHSMDDAGYQLACVIAADNLCIGRTVIADSVNPLTVTRDAWVAVARRSAARVVEIEIICSDVSEHRKRAEARRPDIPGLGLPIWEEIVSREYHPWNSEHVVVDTARQSVQQSVHFLREAIAAA